MNRMIIAAGVAILIVTASFAKDQHLERNKALVRRVFTDILSQGKFEVASEIFAKDFVNHGTTKDIGLDQDQANNHGWRAAFPDLEIIVDRKLKRVTL